MHIKALEICGFKSFVDRTVIHFDHDVIGIVGPNGCGKSNIVDAIRWCMGEQSARHLRGRAMEDVIFNGSESRGPQGVAEVTITFDNGDPSVAAELPDQYRDYPEIAITRRLFRDGTSEYLINQTQVRLRDVTELFLGTGLGSKAYSIVEQGRVGQIISARPEDRRVFIEEAAGITKYKQRRRQAERKMDLTRQNLLRVSDIIGEIDRARGSLKRQVAKAERYLEYRAELEELTLHQASHDYLRFVVLSRVESEKLGDNQHRSAELRSELDSLENGLEAQRSEAAALEIETDEMARAAFEADNEVTELQAEIQLNRDRMQHLTDRLGSLETEQEQVLGRRANLESERIELTDKISDLERERVTREADTAAETETLAEVGHGQTEALQRVQEVQARLSEARSQAAATDAKLAGLQQRQQELQARRDRLESDRDAVIAELGELEARRQALTQSVAELMEGKRLSAEELAALGRDVETLRSRQIESERVVENAKGELHVQRSRLRALEDLHKKHEGVGAGVRALLAYGDPTVVGLVADRIEAPSEMEHALAGLLGERLQAVVVRDLARGAELLSRLRSERRGRAVIVSNHPVYVAGASASIPEHPAVLGRLIDHLRFLPEDEGLARCLLGDAVVVENPEAAIELARQHAGTTFVATDGTVAYPNGSIGGGVGDEIAAHLVEQKRVVRLLGETVARLEQVYAKVAEDHAALRALLAERTAALEQARQQAHAGELARVAADKDLARAVSELERAHQRQTTIDTDLESILRQREQAAAEISTGMLDLDEIRGRIDRLAEELAQVESSAAEWRERVAAQSATVTERKVRLAQITEQVEATRASAAKADQALDELATRYARLEQDVHEAATAFGEAAARTVVAREGRERAHERARDAHARFDSAKASLESLRQVVAERDRGVRELREQLDAVESLAREAEVALARLQIEHDHLLQSIRDKFRGLELSRVVGDYHARPAPDPEQHRRIDELTQLIDRMGPVNLDAKTEFEDAESRYSGLKNQKIDLEKALRDLERAIKLMDKESRRRFHDAFVAINELFKKTFVKLFQGGRAELKLTDAEDLLGSGVDIVAQPPGKKLGNIDLMSGGEKALTAASLIFAIFQYKPSPFCVLDEVDAPLDESNVGRYNDAIRAMTDRSQFIVITHVRKTMQAVDVLYGVTMGEPGVSRVVSVKVNEAAAARSEGRTSNALRESTQPEAGMDVGSERVQVA